MVYPKLLNEYIRINGMVSIGQVGNFFPAKKGDNQLLRNNIGIQSSSFTARLQLTIIKQQIMDHTKQDQLVFESSGDVKVIPTFDAMGLKEDLVRGIYAYSEWEWAENYENRDFAIELHPGSFLLTHISFIVRKTLRNHRLYSNVPFSPSSRVEMWLPKHKQVKFGYV